MISLARYGALFSLIVLLSPVVSAQIYRPGSEYRSLSTSQYEIVIQKNGRLDVATTTGEAIFLNAYPMVWYADEDEPDLARLDGRYSRRFEVNDPLGRGQGMRIRRKEFEWKIRAYPTKPFFAVQFNYINDSKKPVQIKQLLPWCIGEPKNGSIVLGPGTPNSMMLLDSMSAAIPERATTEGRSKNMIALFNPASGRSLIAGFTTQVLASGSIEVRHIDPKPKEPNQFDYMRTASVYDPPITVYPGQVLESEVLYIAITEPDPLIALERFAKAVAVTNEVPNYMEPPKQAVHIAQEGRGFVEYRDVILAAAEEIAAGPLPASEIELLLDASLSAEGFENIDDLDRVTTHLQAKGFDIGLNVNLFSPRSVSNPEWLTSNADGARIIDLTNGAARTWLLAQISSAQQLLDFDAIWGLTPNVYLTAPVGEDTSIRTGVEMAEHAIDLLRTSINRSTRLNIIESDLLPTAQNANTISNKYVPQRFFTIPHLGFRYYMPESADDYLDPAKAFATGTQQVFSYKHWPRVAKMLSESPRYFPTLARPAKPQALFFNDTPNVWLSQQSEKSGAWIVASAHNDTDAASPFTLPIPSVSPRVETQYALFDLDQMHYYGRAANRVNINVPAQSARTLMLREYRGHPTVIGTSRPIAESTPDRTPQSWSRGTLELSGALESDVNESALFVLVPDDLRAQSATVEKADAEWTVENNVVKLIIPGSGDNRVDWSIQFAHP